MTRQFVSNKINSNVAIFSSNRIFRVIVIMKSDWLFISSIPTLDSEIIRSLCYSIFLSTNFSFLNNFLSMKIDIFSYVFSQVISEIVEAVYSQLNN